MKKSVGLKSESLNARVSKSSSKAQAKSKAGTTPPSKKRVVKKSAAKKPTAKRPERKKTVASQPIAPPVATKVSADYTKLRPWTDIELCDCQAPPTQLLLAYSVHENPLRCYGCNKTVDPETLGLDQPLVDKLAAWNKIMSAIYNLWVSAGDYEQWARAALLDSKGEVNQEALKLAAALSEYLPTYYWWWQDPDDEEYLTCPNCGGNIDFDDQYGSGKCERCHIVA